MGLKSELIKSGWSDEGARFVAEHSTGKELSKPLRRFGIIHLRKDGKTQKANIPSGIRWAVWKRDGFMCIACGAQKFLEVDHIYPESKGGTLDLDNLQTLCRKCNNLKGAQ